MFDEVIICPMSDKEALTVRDRKRLCRCLPFRVPELSSLSADNHCKENHLDFGQLLQSESWFTRMDSSL